MFESQVVFENYSLKIFFLGPGKLKPCLKDLFSNLCLIVLESLLFKESTYDGLTVLEKKNDECVFKGCAEA